MEASPVSSRRNIRVILALCLVASLLAFGFVVLRDRKPTRVSSRDIPLPFGTIRSTSLRGQVSPIGTTNENRLIVDMTFDKGETSEVLGANNLTFIVTPEDASTFSSGAPLGLALTPGTRFYGYMYKSADAKVERDMRDYKMTEPQDGEGNPIPLTYSDLFPGTFFASDDDLADDESFPSVFAGEEGVIFHPLSELTLKENSRYLIIAETPDAPDSPKSDTTLTVRGLTWCGDGTPQAGTTEQCDNGADNGKVCDPPYAGTCTYCTASCQNETVTGGSCGDEHVQSPETCDDGGQVSGDGCSDQCVVEADYACSGEKSVCVHHYSWHNTTLPLDANNDGTVNAADGQAITNYINAHPDQPAVDPSIVPVPRYPDVDDNGSITALDVLQIVNWINSQCGNGTPETALGEACDTGAQNGIACTADYAGTCTYCNDSCQNETVTGPFCGDGTTQTDNNEQCDNGTDNGKVCTPAYAGTCIYCDASCQSHTLTGTYCGDGVQQKPQEECDDGNTNDRDSCSNTCKMLVVPF